MADFSNNTKLAIFALVLIASHQVPTASANTDLQVQQMVLIVEPSEQPPVIDLAEILDDPKQTRQRVGWMAALRVGMAAGMYYLQAESVKDQCQGSYCSALGISDLQDIQMGLLQGEALTQMAQVFDATIKSFDEAGMESGAVDIAFLLNAQAGTGAVQKQLGIFTRNFLRATTDFTIVEHQLDELTPTHALRIGISDVGTDGNYVNAGLSIMLKGTAELVDLNSGEVVDSYSHAVKTAERKQTDWSVGGAGVMAQAVLLAMARLSETLSEEVLMVVNSPSQKGRGYLMKPVAPASNRCFTCGKGKMWGNFGFKSQVETHTPSISWEPFEERYAADPLYPQAAGEIRDVQYDVRIYEAVTISRVMGDRIYGAGPLLQEIRGVNQPEITLDEPLPACTRVVWTVRARFVANNTRHLTRWSGHYNERKLERMRRDVREGKGKFTDAMGALMGAGDYDTGRQEGAWYYAFRTPQLEGDKKCKWRG